MSSSEDRATRDTLLLDLARASVSHGLTQGRAIPVRVEGSIDLRIEPGEGCTCGAAKRGAGVD